MNARRRRRSWPALAASAIVGITSASAWAGEPVRAERCAQAYENTQNLKRDGKLVAARKEALVCADQSCAGFLRSDCAVWFDEIERTIPTVVLSAQDAGGRGLVDVSVVIDGTTTAQIDGRPMQVDPGPHTFEFRDATARHTTVRTLVVASDRERLIAAAFDRGGGALSTTGTPRERPSWTVPVTFAALSVVALGGFTALGLSGKSDERNLEGQCGTRCSDADTAPIYRKYLVADISLVVSVVGAALAVITIPRAAATGSDAR